MDRLEYLEKLKNDLVKKEKKQGYLFSKDRGDLAYLQRAIKVERKQIKTRNLSGSNEIFDLMKSAANVLSDNIAYDTDILKFGTGCWKFNCADTKGLYFPLVTKRRQFDLGSFRVDAVEEMNLVPWIAGALALYLIFK